MKLMIISGISVVVATAAKLFENPWVGRLGVFLGTLDFFTAGAKFEEGKYVGCAYMIILGCIMFGLARHQYIRKNQTQTELD